MRVVLTQQAEADLNTIWDDIAGDNVEAADRVLAALEKATNKLAKMPASVICDQIWPTSGIGSFWSIRT